MVQSQPQSEHWALANLQRQGYRCYLPLMRVLRRDRVTPSIQHSILVPLFGNYLFVWLDQADPWTPVHYSRGVRKLLLDSDGHPGMVPDDVIEVLQATDAKRAVLPQAEAPLAAGASVRVANGALAGHPGVVLSVGRERARVGVMIMGGLRDVVVPLESLVARQ